ncbi:hypothetical protein PHLCEN_2v9897 [Hermanssonia centrifuga]|uniref:SH3 domain-containing protein n=1 Tax=Hermanssonia centrifuga TaxID=98765 RepID=A0A2R6NPH3_9APHY|nr:hypothetical protein PHLCEN_2v9897 [Hermanssonia centrifuga]
MAAGSLTLGGNLSIAIGPLGRNGEASGALNTSGKVAAMYSYSKTRGLFGGVSLEGSVIVERQDANAQAYRSDVSVKMLLSGAVPPAEWAQALIKTLEACTGLPGNRRWVSDQHGPQHSDNGYMFGSVESPRDENGLSRAPPIRPSASRSSSYFDFSEDPDGNHDLHAGRTTSYDRVDRNNVPSYGGDRRDADGPTTDFFETKFESDFLSNDQSRKHPRLNSTSGTQPSYPFGNVGSDSNAHKRSVSAYTPSASSRLSKPNPFESSNLLRHGSRSYDFDNANDLEDQDVFGAPIPNAAKGLRGNSPPKLAPKAELTRPLGPGEGVARAIALFDFNAVQSGDLSFKKGQVITVTEMSDNTDTWYVSINILKRDADSSKVDRKSRWANWDVPGQFCRSSLKLMADLSLYL